MTSLSPEQVLAFCQARADQAIALLERMVNVDSGTGDVAGLDQVQQMMRHAWEQRGFQTHMEQTGGDAPCLVATRRAAAAGAPRLLLLGHMDTVFPVGTVKERPFAIEDGRATGPGVADMKGGLVTMLNMVDALEALGALDRLDLTILHNRDEERSSVQSRPVIERLALEADLALVYEPGRPDGSMVVGRRGLQRHRVSVQGRAAHAGVDPGAGANAIEAMAHKVIALHRLNDAERNLSVNVGVIQGGTRPNVVPEFASVEIDVRVADLDSAAYVRERIEAIAAHEELPGTRGTSSMHAERPPLARDPRLEPLLDLFRGVAAQAGLEATFTTTGGGSDGNFTGALGTLTLDGLGPVGGGYHSDREFVTLETIPARAAMTASALALLAEAPERILPAPRASERTSDR